jgi:hypothetical protein
MSLYAIDQRVWCKSEKSLAIVREARYVTVGGKRKAEYVICFVKDEQVPTPGGTWVHPPKSLPDFMTGSGNLRAADWCCDGCERWLRGTHYRAEYDRDGIINVAFCFLCIEALPRTLRELRDAYGWSYYP